MSKNKTKAQEWLHKTEPSSIANFATKFGSGRVILSPYLANRETELEPVCNKFTEQDHNTTPVVLLIVKFNQRTQL